MHQDIILIADDNEEVLNFTAFAVEMMGHRAVKAINGKEAILKANEVRPSLIILDWKMPEIDGMDAAIYFRNDRNFKDTPIIMITGTNETSELMAEAMENGVNDFLRKPFIQIELQARIKSLLKQANYIKQIIEIKINELNNNAIQLAHSIEEKKLILSHLEAISEKTIDNQQKNKITELISKIKVAEVVNPLDKLQNQFSDVNNKFLNNILEVHPNLTLAEIKLYMLLRLNLDTKEIAALLYQTYDSVRVSRTRLREKLNLQNSEKLHAYLIQF